MNTALLDVIAASLIGASLTVAGLSLPVADILTSAANAANAANRYQLATALELYYADHQSYPAVSGGEALINTLLAGDYIDRQPLDPSVFQYEAEANGQVYALAVR